MKKICYVEITNSKQEYWYKGLEGMRFEVYQNDFGYTVKEDEDGDGAAVRCIDFSDCEKVCATCGHVEPQHKTAGGFCKHCSCVEFNEDK